MKLILDVENTVTKRDDKMHLDPFEKDNQLIMVGCITEDGKEHLFHYETGFDGLQELLDSTTILVGHNISYDLMWLWECGFKYDGNVFDTMLVEYVMLRGQKKPLSLEACAAMNYIKNFIVISIVVLLILLLIPIVLPLLLLIYISVGLMSIQSLLNKYSQSLKKKRLMSRRDFLLKSKDLWEIHR